VLLIELLRRTELIIFDMDGVLIEAGESWARADDLLLESFGIQRDRSRLGTALWGKSIREGTELILKEYGINTDLDEVVELRYRIIEEFYTTEVNLFPGVQDFARFLKDSGKKVCIATSCDPRLLAAMEPRIGLSEIFKYIFKIADVDYLSKPDPAIFLYAAEMMECPRKNCLILEDSPNGIRAAKNAGIPCIFVNTAGISLPEDLSLYILFEVSGVKDLLEIFVIQSQEEIDALE